MSDTAAKIAEPKPVSVSQRLVAEGLIGLPEAATIFGSGRGGKLRHPATLTRDINKGARLPDGRRIRLEAVRVNGSFKTSRQAVLRYIEAQNAIDISADDSSAAPHVTPSARRSAQAAASAELDALGVK